MLDSTQPDPQLSLKLPAPTLDNDFAIIIRGHTGILSERIVHILELQPAHYPWQMRVRVSIPGYLGHSVNASGWTSNPSWG